MKKIAILATAAIGMLASCTTNDFVGDENLREANEQGNGAIVFGTGVKAPTRADKTGAAAATELNNNFVVQGVKGDGTPATQNIVFNNYNVNFKDGSANTTTSNTAGWEYVNQTVHAHATTAGIAAQSIKYWDYSASQYDFIAYSAGTATAIATGTPAAGQVLISAIDASKMNGVKTGAAYTDGAYTIEGAADDLAKAYIADMVTAYCPTDYNKEVEFKFRSLAAKVRIALYEIVPGYSVKDVVFYTDASTAATDGKAHLYTTGADVFNKAGKYIVYFPTTGSTNQTNPDYNKAHLAFVADAGGTDTKKTFGTLDLTNTGANKDVAETAGQIYLGRTSNAATFAGDNSANHYTVVIPNENGAVLNLKVNYTLVSTDGSGETINVTGAKAQVPAVYAQWKSGYAYTYLFKISQNSNGLTNPSAGPAGLYPITFDAVVKETEDGVQETITTVAEPSITTYAKGQVVTTKDEYTTGSNIYVVVDNGTALTVDGATPNAKLYTVTLEDTDGSDAITTAAQTINEASVANALAHGGTVTDINKFKMTVTAAAAGTLTAVTEIAAADSPTGTAITVNGAMFTPSAAGTYVFEYIDSSANKKYYKIIKVVTPTLAP